MLKKQSQHFKLESVYSIVKIITVFYIAAFFASCNSNAKNEKLNEAEKSQKSSQAPTFVLKKVVDGLISPVNLAVPHDGSNRLFINEQPGRVMLIKEGKLVAKPFLDLKGKIISLDNTYAESGLLGLVFHPQYKENGRFFVHYTAPSKVSSSKQKSIISEYMVSSDPDVASIESEKIILEVEQPEWNHNGGQLEFGPDGYLYIGLGDGGGGGDYHGKIGNGQNLNTLLGKILRIDVNKGSPYSIPEDNPLVGKEGKKEIWAWGIRNPWRFSFDKATGRLFCADVGQNKYEEVDIIEKGKNYGWRAYEGTHVYDEDLAKKVQGVMPIDEYGRDLGASVTGGYMYRGKKFPAMQGKYIFGDYTGGMFYLREQPKGKWERKEIIFKGYDTFKTDLRINSFGEDELNEIYLLSQKETGANSKTGVLYNIEME